MGGYLQGGLRYFGGELGKVRPPPDDAGVAELARRWEVDIDNEQHPVAEVRQWHLYRIRHFYDALTTQRLVTDPATLQWIQSKRRCADMDMS